MEPKDNMLFTQKMLFKSNNRRVKSQLMCSWFPLFCLISHSYVTITLRALWIPSIVVIMAQGKISKYDIERGEKKPLKALIQNKLHWNLSVSMVTKSIFKILVIYYKTDWHVRKMK